MGAPLPRQRAFLVQYASDADPLWGYHCERIEPVETGRSLIARVAQQADHERVQPEIKRTCGIPE